MPEFWSFWNFLSITVFREFQGWKFWNFLSIAAFRGVNLTKHCNAQKNNFTQPQSSQNLIIAVFRGLNFTKHCNGATFPTSKPTKHCNAQKLPNFSGICPWPGHKWQNFGIFGFFWALQCFLSFRIGSFGMFWALQCFVRPMPQEPRKRRSWGEHIYIYTSI